MLYVHNSFVSQFDIYEKSMLIAFVFENKTKKELDGTAMFDCCVISIG